MFNKYINKNKKNIINSVCDLITYPSISVESENPNFPFGKSCSDALRYFLKLADSLGLKLRMLMVIVVMLSLAKEMK